jgi:hypothetical protein
MTGPDEREEDELERLPPLDGDASDEPHAEPDYQDLLEEAEGEAATLDDATGEDDPPDTSDLDLAGGETGWLGEAGEAQDLDLGHVAIVDFGDEASPLDDGEEPGVGDEDFGFGDAPERGGLDGGDEGPLDADEELREADLPALDADEEGELDDAALVDAAFAADEPLGLPWAPGPWSRVGAPVALGGATAVACAARGALVAGRSEAGAAELVRVDLEGTCERLPAEGLDGAEVLALAVGGNLIATVLKGGRVLVSGDGGRRFEPVAEGIAAKDIVLASGQVWARTRSGGLVVVGANVDPHRSGRSSDEAGTLIERCPIPGVAAALTGNPGSEGSLVTVLVVDDAGVPTALVRPVTGGTARREAIDAPEVASPTSLAARGEHLAYSARRGGVVRRIAGRGWMPFEWEGRVTALVLVDDAGTLVASTYVDADDTTALVRLDPGGNASVVARIGPSDPESDGRVVAMAHDEARGVVWVAGGFGVAAFATR